MANERHSANKMTVVLELAAVLVILLLTILATQALPQRRQLEPPPSVTACEPPSHACDPEEDFVLRWVTVEEVSPCGFRCSTSREAQADPIRLGPIPGKLSMGTVVIDGKPATLIYSGVLEPGQITRGSRGLAVYCSTCRSGAMLRTTQGGKAEDGGKHQ